MYVADRNGRRVQKFSSKGQFLRLNETPAPANETRDAMVGLSVDALGTVFLSNSNDNLIRVYDPSGQFLRELPNLFSYVGHVSINREGTRLLVTEQYSDIISSYAATTPRSTHVAQLHGHIFHDRDLSCEAKGPGLADIVVVAEPGNYYGLSDENGNYTIEADTGRYTVRQLLPNEPGRNIHQTCVTQPTVHLAAYDTTVPGPAFGD